MVEWWKSTWSTAALAMTLALPLDAATLPEIEATTIGSFSVPLYVTNAGDDRLFVVERAGRIRIYDPAVGTLVTPFLDIHLLVDSTRDGGMYTMAFHPNYAENGFFFLAYTETGQETDFDSVLARYRVSPGDPNVADPASGRVLLRVSEPFSSHNIDQVAFGPDGYLYVSFGNGAERNAASCLAQHGDTLHGKILRLDVDQNVDQEPYYGIPDSNPFAGDDGVRDEIWAKGFRNPWRFSFDALTGDLFIGDVGEMTREEISFQSASSLGGENYGWKVMEGTTCFDPDRSNCPVDTPPCFDPSYVAPIHEYPRTTSDCAVTGGYVYRGEAIPGLEGRYVFGDLCSGKVQALEEVSEGVWTSSPLLTLGSPIRFGLTSFGVDADGELYATLANDVVRLPEPSVRQSRVVALTLLFAFRFVSSFASSWVARRRRPTLR